MGIDVPVISLASPAFADSPEEAEQALALFGTCPVVEQALVKVPYMPTDLPAWYDVAMTHYLSDHHYAVDNMWTSASAEDHCCRVSAQSWTRCPRIRRTSSG